MEKNILWKDSTKKAMYGLIAGIALNGVLNSIFGFVPGVGIVFSILALAAFVFYFLGIKGMKEASSSTSYAPALNNLYISAIIIACSIIVDIIPLLGWLASLAAIASYVFAVLAYNDLRKRTENTLLSQGGKLLFIASIVAAAEAFLDIVIGWIPVVGDIFGTLINLAVVLLLIFGWLKFSKSELEETQPVKEEVQPVEEEVQPVKE